MLDFIVDRQTCTKCGQCVADCPAQIIDMRDSGPAIAADKEEGCYRCQHCLTVCPVGAVSIMGFRPEDSIALAGNLPDPRQLEILMRGRRSVRRYKEENLEPEILQRLLDVASYAPSGMNDREVRFTVVDDRAKLAELRVELMAELIRMVSEATLPRGTEFYGDFVKLWIQERNDFLFRGAPHLLVASAPSSSACAEQDCLIALTYFELFAQSMGVGTVWDGLATGAISTVVPSMRKRLGIPNDHVVGYAMTFGRPAAHYARTAQHEPAEIHRVK